MLIYKRAATFATKNTFPLTSPATNPATNMDTNGTQQHPTSRSNKNL